MSIFPISLYRLKDFFFQLYVIISHYTFFVKRMSLFFTTDFASRLLLFFTKTNKTDTAKSGVGVVFPKYEN